MNGLTIAGNRMLTSPQATLFLPTAVVEQLLAFQERKISGWIQLNFNSGELQSWQKNEHHRLNK